MDLGLLESCTVDVIKRYRNHPSLVMYLCMVERTPPKDVYEMWRRHVVELDGTRWFVPSGIFPTIARTRRSGSRRIFPRG